MRESIEKIIAEIGKVLLGKDQEIKLALTCLLADGHLLIEDLPGMGKTTLAHALAKVLGLQYQRVQFTSDMLPADILGVSVFEASSNGFSFHPGPVFTQVLLADEINRTTPKTQSALLEAMEERQVTIDGQTRKLDEPFFVIATQNPQSQMGTFPLPESQLDRFLMRISLGYPDPDAELELYRGGDSRRHIEALNTLASAESLSTIRVDIESITASDALLGYLQRLVHETRHQNQYAHGLSPRGALALLNAAKAWAYMHARDYVKPEDVQAVLPSVVAHRVLATGEHGGSQMTQLLSSVDIVG